MKILYITNSDTYSGASIALENILKDLDNKIQYEVVFPRKKGLFSKALDRRGIKYYHIRYTFFTYANTSNPIVFILRLVYTLLINLWAVLNLLIICARFKPDIIHTNVGPINIGYIVAKILQIPHVWHLREYIDKDFNMHLIPSFNQYTRQFASPINNTISITDDVKDHFPQNRKAVCIYDGPLQKAPTEEKEKSNYFLFVGRLQEAKGDFVLLKAYTDYIKNGGNYKLKYAGVGTDLRIKFLKNYVQKHKLEDKVEFLGFRTDVYDLMSHAIALFVPSRFEGFGFITTEAMYNHCLVVGRNTAGTKTQFDNGLNLYGQEIGIRFNDDKEIWPIMKSLETLEQGQYLSLAYKTVCELYTSQRSANQVLAFYKNILGI